MSYVAPDTVVDGLVNAGTTKGKLPARQLLLRGALAGALLGFATTFAFTAALQTNAGIVGALVFPAGFAMIVLLGFELVTGNFALLPLALIERRISATQLASSWGLVFAGNLAGSILYALLFAVTVHGGTPMADRLVQLAEAKTLAYEAAGSRGMAEVFVKAILCNWMVTLGVVMAFTSTTTAGKILGMWLPVTVFFAQGFEHSVVNMFVIPAGMIAGADVSIEQWWLWNQIPVTLGNIVGGVVFTGLALYLAQRRRTASVALAPEVTPGALVPAEANTAA